ncbi:hypothetical protein HOY82DRAFT_84937 [Tuber indicum]|nr:hypothetical protein HOY82DRAFT_84937 [Tuber indicum]
MSPPLSPRLSVVLGLFPTLETNIAPPFLPLFLPLHSLDYRYCTHTRTSIIHSLVCIPCFRTPPSLFPAGGRAKRDENPNVSDRLQDITNTGSPAWSDKLKMFYTLSLNLALPIHCQYLYEYRAVCTSTSTCTRKQVHNCPTSQRFLGLVSYALPAKSSVLDWPQFYGVVRYGKVHKDYNLPINLSPFATATGILSVPYCARTAHFLSGELRNLSTCRVR